MTIERSLDGVHVLLLLEVGEAISLRLEIEKVAGVGGRLEEIAKALETLLPERLEKVVGATTKKET